MSSQVFVVVFVVVTVLVGMRWNLIVPLICISLVAKALLSVNCPSLCRHI